jgi:ribosome maturation factor RimP
MRRHWVLEQVISPVVEGLGYIFVGLRITPQGRSSLVQLYVDKVGGITIDECAQVSRQVDAVMTVKGSIQGEYILEVSSPGLDRLLFTIEQFREQIGKNVAIRLTVPMEERRNFKGIIEDVGEENISIRMESDTVQLAFADISEARIVPEW